MSCMRQQQTIFYPMTDFCFPQPSLLPMHSIDVCCCRLNDVASLTSAATFLLANLSWKNVEQYPGRLPMTLLSKPELQSALLSPINTSRACQAPTAVHPAPKASFVLTTKFTVSCLPNACNSTLVAICCSICQSTVERLSLNLQKTALHCRETASTCSHPTC